MGWEGLNRRRFPRANYPCLLKIHQDNDPGQVFLTHTENISSGGVGVIVKKHFELFAMIGMELDLMDGEDIIHCKGKVVWTVRRKATLEDKPSFYDIGVEFVDLKEEDSARLQKVVDGLVKGQLKAKIF